MSSEPEPFVVLHAVRVRGLVGDEPLARATGLAGKAAGQVAAALADDGLLERKEFPRRSGWILTADGTRHHAETLEERRRDGLLMTVEGAYLAFLNVNGPFKELCTDWQLVAATQQSARAAFAAELEEIAARAQGALTAAATAAKWFGPYAPRLVDAVERLRGGDDRYLISPQLDSIHTVWSECHEDFLVTLGRERSEADEW